MLYGTIPKIQEHFKKHSRLRSLKKVRIFGFIPQPKEIGILGLTFVSLKNVLLRRIKAWDAIERVTANRLKWRILAETPSGCVPGQAGSVMSVCR